MNKETIIVLIEKEINELAVLTKGFSQLDEFPQPLVNLAIEKANNLRDCLEKLSKNENVVVEEPVVQEEVKAQPVEETPVVAPEPEVVAPEPIVEPEPVQEIEQDAEEEPAEQDFEVEVEVIDEEQEQEEQPVEEQVSESVDEPQIVAETIHKSESVVDAFSHQNDNSVASSIAHQPISDIKEALSIADRFRFQRELFESNGEKLTKTLDAINASSSLEETMNYFKKNFRWNYEDSTVKDFIALVQRRFA